MKNYIEDIKKDLVNGNMIMKKNRAKRDGSG